MRWASTSSEVSCAFLAPAIMREVQANGRAFLRNVRHGLYMLPFTVRDNIGLGCPVDPSFAVGGERHKNPYGEKLDLAARRRARNRRRPVGADLGHGSPRPRHPDSAITPGLVPGILFAGPQKDRRASPAMIAT